jgi:cell division protein FtsA
MSNAPPYLPHVLGLLDIGTFKIVCVMLAADAQVPGYRIIGVGHQRARGLKASVIVDADAAEETLRAAVTQAEHMAGQTLENVIVAAACGRLMSTHVAAGLDLAAAAPSGRAVTAADIDRLLAAGRTHAERDDRAVLNINVIAAQLDGTPISQLEIGASGQRLSVDVHAVTVDRSPLRHLMHVVERCQLNVLAIAPSPIAAALAVTSFDERQARVIVIDLGAGSTGLAVLMAGAPVLAHVFPIGGNHLTFDLMRALGTSFTEAERIKKNYAMQGSAHAARDDAIAYLGHDNTHAEADQATTKQVMRADISQILTSRLDALLRQVLLRLDQFAPLSVLNCDVVLTGGGSLLQGLPELAATVLGRPVRLGMPTADEFLPKALSQPAFATAVGLEHFARHTDLGLRFDIADRHMTRTGTSGTNLRQSF